MNLGVASLWLRAIPKNRLSFEPSAANDLSRCRMSTLSRDEGSEWFTTAATKYKINWEVCILICSPFHGSRTSKNHVNNTTYTTSKERAARGKKRERERAILSLRSNFCLSITKTFLGSSPIPHVQQDYDSLQLLPGILKSRDLVQSTQPPFLNIYSLTPDSSLTLFA